MHGQQVCGNEGDYITYITGGRLHTSLNFIRHSKSMQNFQRLYPYPNSRLKLRGYTDLLGAKNIKIKGKFNEANCCNLKKRL